MNNSVDNFEVIKCLLTFESEDDFYYLQILQRKKENPQLGSNSRVIKNYYINNLEYLDSKKEEIINLCNQFNARASIRLNKRSYRKTAFKTLINISNNMSNEDYKNIGKSYDKACGQTHNDKNKKWILDIDGEFSPEFRFAISEFLSKVEPVMNSPKCYATIPSKNGFHLITSPFNLKKWKEEFPYVEVHKDNPTNLYIP